MPKALAGTWMSVFCFSPGSFLHPKLNCPRNKVELEMALWAHTSLQAAVAPGCGYEVRKKGGFCSKVPYFWSAFPCWEWAWHAVGTSRPCHHCACCDPALSAPRPPSLSSRDTHEGWNCRSSFEFLDAASPWPYSAVQLFHPVGTTVETELERI